MKSKTTAAILALFLGGLGIHKFYLGRTGWGIAYFLFFWTFIPAIVALIEGIKYLVMSEHDFNLKYNGGQYITNMVAQGVAAGNAASPINVTVSSTDFAGRTTSTTADAGGWNRIRTSVAGFQHHDGPTIESMLKPGLSFQLVREADNQYDNNAVKVMMGKYFLGYVPRDDAADIAEAMDSGSHVQATCLAFNTQDMDYHKLRIEISRAI